MSATGMDKSDLILAAIDQMGRNFDAKINGLEAKIDAMRTELKGGIVQLRAELKSDIGQVGAGVIRLESEVKTESRVFNARLDEQRQTINALIPQRLAAVGRTDAAE